jgi:hypothetical protein
MAISRFSRQFRAVEYNYGGNGVQDPAALVVISGSNAAGVSGTLTVQNGFFTMTDGTKVTPFNTNAPTSIVNASGADTQTPSAVSTNVQSNTFGPTATITATWTNAHAPGDRVSSGTAGLQEAINHCNSLGGGTVVVDAQWTAEGGTTAMLIAASYPGGVRLLDNRFGQGTSSTSVILSNAQILNLSSTAVQLLPAPGANYFYNILKATVVNESGGTAYSAGGAITIGYGTAANTQALSGTIASTFLTSPTVAQVIQLAGANLASTTEALYDNQPISMLAATANFTTGSGTLKVSLTYTLEGK